MRAVLIVILLIDAAMGFVFLRSGLDFDVLPGWRFRAVAGGAVAIAVPLGIALLVAMRRGVTGGMLLFMVFKSFMGIQLLGQWMGHADMDRLSRLAPWIVAWQAVVLVVAAGALWRGEKLEEAPM